MACLTTARTQTREFAPESCALTAMAPRLHPQLLFNQSEIARLRMLWRHNAESRVIWQPCWNGPFAILVHAPYNQHSNMARGFFRDKFFWWYFLCTQVSFGNIEGRKELYKSANFYRGAVLEYWSVERNLFATWPAFHEHKCNSTCRNIFTR